METPFELGKQYWCPKLHPIQDKVTCPICAGHLTVMVTLGDGQRVVVPCDACGLGYDGPRGWIREYSYEPQAERFIPSTVSSMSGGSWWLLSEAGESHAWSDCYATEEEAMAESRKRMAEIAERNHQSRCHRKKALSKTAWSIRYHREQIKDLERQIAWHQSKIQQP